MNNVDVYLAKSVLEAMENFKGDDVDSGEEQATQINEALTAAEEIQQRRHDIVLSDEEESIHSYGDAYQLTQFYNNRTHVTSKMTGPTFYERDVIPFDKPRVIPIKCFISSEKGYIVYDAMVAVFVMDDGGCVVASRHSLPHSSSACGPKYAHQPHALFGLKA